MRRSRILAAAVMACGTLAAAPAAVQAATVAVPPCATYLAGSATVPVQGSGFAPGSQVSLAADGRALTTVTADATGAFAQDIAAPDLSSVRRNQQTFQLTATDAAGTAAVTPMRITRLNATLPAQARPTSVVRYRVFGFPPRLGTVYLHIRRNGRTLGSYRIGAPQAPCGNASKRLRYMPLKRYPTGIYDYVFQPSRTYSADALFVRLRIQIVRRVRTG